MSKVMILLALHVKRRGPFGRRKKREVIQWIAFQARSDERARRRKTQAEK